MFTSPLIGAENTAIVLNGSVILTAADLDKPGVKISVFTGNGTDNFMTREFHNATIVRLATDAAAGAAFKAGQVDAYASARSIGVAYATANMPGRARALPDNMFVNKLTPFLHPSTPDAVCYMKAYIEAAKTSGLVQKAIDRSAGSHAGRIVPAGVATCPPNARCKNVTVVAGADICEAGASIDNGSDSATSNLAGCTQSPAGSYGLGATSVTLTCTDTTGKSASCQGTVTVVDTTPPVVATKADADGFIAALWSPNGNYQAVSLADCIDPAVDQCGGAVTAVIVGVSSDEAAGPGHGKKGGDDIVLVDDTTVSLRAERAGSGDGRVYTLFVIVRDESGNATAVSCKVQVPHDKSGAPAVDSGMAYCVGNC